MTMLVLGLGAATYPAFCGTAVALILAPGPDTMYILACGLDGCGPGVRSVLDIATGALLHTLPTMVGAAAPFRIAPEAVAALKYVGATYLGYLGVTSLRGDEFDPLVETDAGASSRCGVLVNVPNLKVALFSLVFLPGSAGQGAGVGVRVAGLDATYAALMALYLLVAALGANRLRSGLAETWVASTLNYVGVGMILLLGVVLTLG